MKKVIVTGASGFIGTQLIRHLLVLGDWEVVSLGIEPCPVDGAGSLLVGELDGLEAAKYLAGSSADAIIHLAGAGVNPGDRDLSRLVVTNAVLPSRMVQLAAEAGIPVVVMAGSCSEYSSRKGGGTFDEDAPLETQKLYGTTKAAGSLLALSCGASLGVAVGVARIFNVYGPGERPHRLLPSLWSSLSQGQRVALSPGRQVRDFIYIEDVCEGLKRLTEGLGSKTATSGAYNLCTGLGNSVRDFALAVAQAMGADPSFLGFGDIPMRPDDTDSMVGNPDRWRTAMGWVPKTSLEEGIKRSLGILGKKGTAL